MNVFPIMIANGYGITLSHLRRNYKCLMAVGVPMELLLKHAVQLEKNHGQSIERLASRGGLDANEMLAVLEDRPVGVPLTTTEANARLVAILTAYLTTETV